MFDILLFIFECRDRDALIDFGVREFSTPVEVLAPLGLEELRSFLVDLIEQPVFEWV